MIAATTPTRFDRWTWGLASSAVVLLGMALIFLSDHRYFYLDDTESGAVGNWLALGRLMREGQFLPLVTTQWMAGNYPVEGQGGLWNPVQMGINFLAPSVDNMALYAAIVKIGFAVVLALGVYRVALEYGARPVWAAVAAAAVPFSGFTLFFEQPSWVTSLIGMAWVIQAWASAVRYVRGKSGPVPVFVFLYLAISVGYVHAALMAGVAAGAVMIGEYIYSRQLLPVAKLAAVSVAAAMCGAITFLPGVLTSGVTWRSGAEGTLNDNFLVVPWSETFSASLPTAVSSMESWGGETTMAPVTYIAWFCVPMLAFVDWRRVSSGMRELSGPAILLGALLLYTAGPSDIGPIRWPARLLPFVACVLLVGLAVLMSRYGTLRSLRGRLTAAAILVGVLFVRALSSGPQLAGRHVLAAVLVLTAGGLLILVVRRWGVQATAALLMISVIPVALYQIHSYPKVLTQWHFPTSQSEAKAGFPDWTGTTLQLGSRVLTERTENDLVDRWRAQAYGNYAKVLDLNYVSAYTPVGHQAFSSLLCVAYEGSTCSDAYSNLFRPDVYTGRTSADLMLLDRVVVQKAQYPEWRQLPVSPGWRWVDVDEPQSDQVAVLERDNGYVSLQNGTVSATVDATVEPVASSAVNESMRVSSPTGGSVVFARLAWPGYTAMLNGEPLQTKGLGDTFLYVDVPAGTTDADLEIQFRPPGFRIGLAAMGGGLVILVVLIGLDIRRRRRVEIVSADPAAAPAAEADAAASERGKSGDI
ncbi:hypothetical protein QMK17_13130 [Rhodococcus sp. G-MC3]|uniref:hypothetical protein n=1 Tax=Rhodococcus sp. G-MC3 TaxID=3046209 RepID=UPI0024B9F879|nr:hypothetical protein [Rhodococcus sp. G-MC3]MDJ0394269.1 hypothetical protein [Rhodococcus sp. G-MC3]